MRAPSMVIELHTCRAFKVHNFPSLSRKGPNPAECLDMSGDETDLRDTISRHEREIDELQEQVRLLQDGHVKERVEAEIAQKMTLLEADLKLHELQETMGKEEAAKQRKRGLFRRR
jgi:hypothetical protein